MSRQNKVNPDHYTTAGRLSPDDLARERMKQGETHLDGGGKPRKAMPPWIANEGAAPGATGATGATGAIRRVEIGKQGEANRGSRTAGTTRASKRASPKQSGARKTPRTRKAPRARGSTARRSSPQGRKGAARKSR